MFTKTVIQRTLETNSDVPNDQPTAKQDCSDVVHKLTKITNDAKRFF